VSVQSVGLFICIRLTGFIACCLPGHLETLSVFSGVMDCCAVWVCARMRQLRKCPNALVHGPSLHMQYSASAILCSLSASIHVSGSECQSALPVLSLRVCRLHRGGTKGAALRAGALAHVTSYLPEEDYVESPSIPGAAALSPQAAAHTQRGVDYEFGKAFDRQDADKYFGGMISESTPLRSVRLCMCAAACGTAQS